MSTTASKSSMIALPKRKPLVTAPNESSLSQLASITTDLFDWSLQSLSSSRLSDRYTVVHDILIPAAARFKSLTGDGSDGDLVESSPTNTTSDGAESQENSGKVTSLARLLETSVSVVLHGLTHWLDHTSQRYLLSLIASLASSVSQFVPLLLSSLYSYLTANIASIQYNDEMLVWVRTLSLTLSLTNDRQLQSLPFTASLLSSLSLLTNKLLDSNYTNHSQHYHRLTETVKHCLSSLIATHPSLLATMMADAAKQQHYHSLSLLLSLSSPSTLSSMIDVRTSLLTLYEQSVLAQKDATMLAFQHQSLLPLYQSLLPLYQSLTQAEFQSLLPLIERLSKRSPELLLAVLGQLLEAVKLDLSAYHKSFVPLIVTELKHSDETRRNNGLAAVKALITHTSSVESLQSLATVMVEHLNGKHGALAQPVLRTTLLQSLSYFASLSSLSSSAQSSLSQTIIALLVDYNDRESAPEARAVGVKTIGKHLYRVSEMTDKLSKHFIANLSRTKDGNSIYSYLSVAYDTITNTSTDSDKMIMNENVRNAMVLTIAKSNEVLVTHIKNATAKPIQHRREGLVSLALLLATQSPLTPALSKTVTVLLKESGSFVNLHTLIDSVSADDCDCYLRLLLSLLSSPTIVHSDSEQYLSFYQTIIRLTLHKQQPIRAKILLALKPLLQNDCNLLVIQSMIVAFEQLIKGKNSETLASSALLSQSLLTLTTTNKALPAQSLPLLTLIASDPLVDSAAIMHHHYQSLTLKAIVKRVSDSEKKYNECVGELTSLVTASLTSESVRARQAASVCFVTLFSVLPTVVTPSLSQSLLSSLSQPTLLTLTDYDIAVYHTPEGQLCTYKRDDVFKPTVVESKNVKGRKKEDDEFARMQKEIDKKKGKVDAETKKLVEEQTALRLKIALSLTQARTSLTVVNVLAQHQSSLTAQHLLASLLTRIYPLFNNALIKSDAIESHTMLLQTLDSGLQSLSLPLALAIQLTFTKSAKLWDTPLYVSLVEDVLTDLHSRVKRRPMSVSSWLYISPLITAVLMQSKEQQASNDTEKGNGTTDDEDEDESVTVTSSGSATTRPGYRPGFIKALNILIAHCQPSVLSSPSPSQRFPLTHFISLFLHLLNHTTLQLIQINKAFQSIAPFLNVSECCTLVGDDGLLSEASDVRLTVLQVLSKTSIASSSGNDSEQLLLTYRTFIVRHDSDELIREASSELFQQFRFQLTDSYMSQLLPLLSHRYPHVRLSTAQSIAAALTQFPKTSGATLQSLIKLFQSSNDIVVRSNRPSTRDEPLSVQSHWETRDGIVLAFQHAALAFSDKQQVLTFFNFLISHALRDTNDTVWDNALKSGMKFLDLYGSQYLNDLLPVFITATQSIIDDNASDAEAWKNDRVREGSVIFFGTIAKYLSDDSRELLTVMDSLIELLRTPSHSVQKSVSECLPGLMTHTILVDNAQSYIDLLLQRLSTGEDYGERKGSAFGLAGLVKGLKLGSLKKYNVLDSLKSMIENNTSNKARQGALFAYERLFFELGAKFEPYVVSILPNLLACFGDQSDQVREAAQECARIIMSHLTGHGVKMVLPLVLGTLHDTDKKSKESKENSMTWRNKLESISMLGSLSYCAPQQLSTALPQIVPRLLEVMTDPNIKLQSAAKTALKQIGSVIRNPEILVLVPVLLAALNDPSLNTKKALNELMSTSFIHTIDPPSLALIVPIVKKGLRGRTPTTKKMAAQVVGSICSLIGDVKDILPYAEALLKHLKEILVDPIPDVRSVAARAMGSLYAGIRNNDVDNFNSLLNDLILTLKSDTTSVQRSGAAQGMAQVLSVEGTVKTRELLPQLFAETHSEKAVVREGFFDLFAALPDAFQSDEFSVFLSEILPVVVEGLADEIGLVREAALTAGQSLVLHYATTQTELLLPALETGLLADDWRIRLSSVQLLGLLLLRVAGLSGKYLVGLSSSLTQSQEEDGENIKDANTVTTKEQELEIEVMIGTERRNRLFAYMYLMRSDTVIAVREMAWRVWKGLVTATPRMLNLILPTMMNTVIIDLASASIERQSSAGAALGELVVKLGDAVLTSILPILQSRLDSDDENTRRGVCLGFAEVIKHARKADIHQYVEEIIPSLRDSLCDQSLTVRQAAGRAFMVLHRQIGRRALDEVLPSLIEQLDAVDSNDTEQSSLLISGIKEILSLCGEPVLPFLIPTLIQAPMTLFHTHCLAMLADQLTVTGRGFSRYVVSLIQSLLQSMASNADNESDAALRKQSIERIVTIITSDTVQLFLETIVANMEDNLNDSAMKIACASLIAMFANNSKVYFDPYLPLVLQSLLRLWNDSDNEVVDASWDAMETLSKIIPDERMSRHIDFIRQCLSEIHDTHSRKHREPLTALPGLTVKKGLAPLLPAFQYTLLHGTPVQRVSAANGLGELISLSSESTLSSHVIKLTGPLIRIVGDRFPSDVKSAILQTLDLLLVKTGKFLKPFLPQLQTTFSKALIDRESNRVRHRAAVAMSHLMLHTPLNRVELVLGELLTNTIASSQPTSVRATVFDCLTRSVRQEEIGAKLSDEVKAKLLESSVQCSRDESDEVRKEAAHTVATTLIYCSDDKLAETVSAVVDDGDDEWQSHAGHLSVVAFIARLMSSKLTPALTSSMARYVTSHINNQHRGVQHDAMVAAGEVMVHCNTTGDCANLLLLLSSLASLVTDDLASVRQLAASRIGWFAQHTDADLSHSVLELSVPPLLTRMTDSNGPVKRASEAALYHLLAFHRGTDKAERTINAFGAKMKKDSAGANTVNAMIATAKKTLVRLEQSEIRASDELTGGTSTSSSVDDSNAE